MYAFDVSNLHLNNGSISYLIQHKAIEKVGSLLKCRISTQLLLKRTIFFHLPSWWLNELFQSLNTQYMTNSTLVSPVKMEYVTKNNIFGLKMMMKSGLEKIILKFLHAQTIFY